MQLTNMLKGWVIALIFISSVGSVIHAQQQSTLLPFQGQLTNQAGEIINPTAPLTLIFRIYSQPVGGPVIWEEVQPNVAVIGGRFTVLLGARNRFSTTVDFSHVLYLGITIDDGDTTTTDVEMRPRQAVIPTAYATNAGNATKLAGYDWSDVLIDGSNNPTKARIRSDKLDEAPFTELKNQIADLRKGIDSLSQRLDVVVQTYPPIGAVIPFFLTPQEASKLAPVWLPADGKKINDSLSQLNGRMLPNLVDRFVSGADAVTDVTAVNDQTQSGTSSLNSSQAKLVGETKNEVWSAPQSGWVGTPPSDRYATDTGLNERWAPHIHKLDGNFTLTMELPKPPFRKLIYLVRVR